MTEGINPEGTSPRAPTTFCSHQHPLWISTSSGSSPVLDQHQLWISTSSDRACSAAIRLQVSQPQSAASAAESHVSTRAAAHLLLHTNTSSGSPLISGLDSIFDGLFGFGGARSPVSPLAHSACMPRRCCDTVRVRVFGGAPRGCQSPADENEGEREATAGSFSPDLSTLCNRGELLLPGCAASMLPLPARRQNRSAAGPSEPTGAAGGSLSGPHPAEGWPGFDASNADSSVRSALRESVR